MKVVERFWVGKGRGGWIRRATKILINQKEYVLINERYHCSNAVHCLCQISVAA